MRISAFLPVYNEEARIENCLKTISWCDEIIVLDKESSDRTREIASRYTSKIFSMPNSSAYSASEMDCLFEHCTSEWVLFYTASDLMHPDIARQIKAALAREDFPYDIIEAPFHRYVLGVGTKESPWYSEHAACAARLTAIHLNRGKVHDAISLASDRVYRVKGDRYRCMYHLTHETADRMMERHLRYWRGEAADAKNVNLRRSSLQLIKCLYDVFLRRRTFYKGQTGRALSFAYLSYYLMSYVYQWEKKYGDSSNYQKIAERIIGEWRVDSDASKR